MRDIYLINFFAVGLFGMICFAGVLIKARLI